MKSMSPIEFKALRRTYVESLRPLLARHYQQLPDNAILEMVQERVKYMSPDEFDAFSVLTVQNAGEGFFDILKKAGKAIAPIAKIAAPVVGSMMGPVGGMIGSQVGNLLGQLGGVQGSPPPPAPQAGPAAAVTAPAANDLMALLANPQLLQSLLGQVMGKVGKESVLVERSGGKAVPVSFASIMNTLSELAQRAAEESIRNGAMESEDYLYDYHGNSTVSDLSDAGQRADAIRKLLKEDFHVRKWREEGSARPVSYRRPISESQRVSSWLISAGLIR